LAEFFNQSRSDTVLANGGQFMDRTCTTESLQNPLLIYFKAKKKKKNTGKYTYIFMNTAWMQLGCGYVWEKKLNFLQKQKGVYSWRREMHTLIVCLKKKVKVKII